MTVETAVVAEVLERSQQLGFLGPGAVATHVRHAAGFAAGLVPSPRRALDLGSGGGVPGLVLAAVVWPTTPVVLLEASERRCVFLGEAVAALAIGDRVTVRRLRAEEAGRRDDLRGGCDVVVARSFGRPGVTAECAAPLLAPGGVLVVSEPPADARTADEGGTGPAAPAPVPVERWPETGLARVGLRRGRTWQEPYAYQALVQAEPCPDRYPRRVGIPAKRPLF